MGISKHYFLGTPVFSTPYTHFGPETLNIQGFWAILMQKTSIFRRFS